MPDPESTQEPFAKRQKPADRGNDAALSVAGKAARDHYANLESVLRDIKACVKDQLAELQAIGPGEATKANDEAVAKTIAFGQKASEFFRRETTYPNPTRDAATLRALDTAGDLQSNASGNIVLSIYGDAQRSRQLFSSLQQRLVTPEHPEGVIQPLREGSLPPGVKTAKAIPFSFASAVEKEKKAKTLGQLFPAPSNLPSLQPPKAPKSTTKGVQVGWHHPELTEKSKYRSGSYFGQTISTGRWLDYSNAAPPSQIMTKQRERALSLAGTKPSTTDLETTEMESLFRGAFSSFAPTRDDSAAMVSSGLISQTTWWQKVGKRNFDRLIEQELGEEPAEEAIKMEQDEVMLDEDLINEAIETWDDKIDPSLEELCNPKKSQEDKDVDELLEEISDMIQTLISFQKNRNLSLPSTQRGHNTDPANNDMLTAGSPVQPSAEETATYETLKAQLLLIIQTLPPFAVARLNSDKLEELNISTKLEIRSDEYQGVMEEDESAARARAAAQQQAAAAARPVSHRSSSSSSNLQYNNQQYQGNNRGGPMPNQAYYGPQTPVRPSSGMQRPPATMPPAYGQQQPPPSRGAPPTGYRPQNGYPAAAPNYGQHGQQYPPKAPYNQPGANPYGTPAQSRPPQFQHQPQPPYHNMANASPQARYPAQAPGPQPPYQQQQQQYPPQQPIQPGTPSHAPPYHPYVNGTPSMPPRNASPHVPHQQAPPYTQPVPQHAPPPQPYQHQPPHAGAYNPNATPSRPPSFSGPPNVGNGPQQRFYPPAGNSPMPTHNPNPSQSQPNSQGPPFQTSISPLQVQQAMDQAKARFENQKNVQRSNEGLRNSISGQGQVGVPVGSPVGLGGIGLNGARPPTTNGNPTGAAWTGSSE